MQVTVQVAAATVMVMDWPLSIFGEAGVGAPLLVKVAGEGLIELAGKVAGVIDPEALLVLITGTYAIGPVSVKLVDAVFVHPLQSHKTCYPNLSETLW